jgi:hypothetical protein
MDIKPLTEGHPTLPNFKLRTVNDSNMAIVRTSFDSDKHCMTAVPLLWRHNNAGVFEQWRLLSSGMWHRVVGKINTDVSERTPASFLFVLSRQQICMNFCTYLPNYMTSQLSRSLTVSRGHYMTEQSSNPNIGWSKSYATRRLIFGTS